MLRQQVLHIMISFVISITCEVGGFMTRDLQIGNLHSNRVGHYDAN